MTTKPLVAIDTNVLVYAVGVHRHPDDAAKIAFARDLMPELTARTRLVVPVQALAELHEVLRKLDTFSRSEVRDEVDRVRRYSISTASSEHTLNAALQLATWNKFRIFDALIVCAADEAGARWLLTEDMQDGFAWGKLRLLNPFALAIPEVIERLTSVS